MSLKFQAVSLWGLMVCVCYLLCYHFLQLFYSFFKSLVGKEVIVELKNDLWYEY